MGIFSDNVRRYYEHGIVTIPCKNKRPILGNEWEIYCNEKPSESMIDRWEVQFKDAQQLGMAFGEATQFAGFDFDYDYDERKCSVTKMEFEKDKRIVERQILALLPLTPVIKTGKKGWTRIYRTPGVLSNAQSNRNGIRLFDFLARNKQTIIPPSKYDEGTDLTYRWLADPIEDCLDDIPIVTQEIIDEIKILFSESKGGFDFEGNGRHGILFRWLLDVVKLEASDEKLARALVLMDIKINGTNAYLSDQKHFGSISRFPEKSALIWIKRVRKFVNVTPNKSIFSGKDGWDYLFNHSFERIKKDIISKDVFIKSKTAEDWQAIKGLEGVLRAYALDNKMKASQAVDQLDRWIFEKTDVEFLCDLPKWDGIDRVQSIANCIGSVSFTDSDIADIFKHWGSNIFRRVESPNNQNRCIVLKGPQGIGKDHMVRNMLDYFKPYYESTTLPGNPKDILEIVSRLLVVHIEEFDQTKGMDISFLKSLITQPSAFFRESYGYSPNKKIMRPNFISTANVDDFLRDPTGNRRFIVIPVDSIKWDYPRGESIQIMAQFKHYFESGEYRLLSKPLENKIRAVVDSFTPDDISDSIIDLYRHRFFDLVSPQSAHPGITALRFPHVAPMLADVARLFQCSTRKVQSVIKAKGYSKHSEKGAIYYGNLGNIPKESDDRMTDP